MSHIFSIFTRRIGFEQFSSKFQHVIVCIVQYTMLQNIYVRYYSMLSTCLFFVLLLCFYAIQYIRTLL